MSRETTKKSRSGPDGVNREGGAQVSCCFGPKLLNTQRTEGRRARKSPIMKGASGLEESSKKFFELEHNLSQQRQLVH